jgi:hypothetical protein
MLSTLPPCSSKALARRNNHPSSPVVVDRRAPREVFTTDVLFKSMTRVPLDTLRIDEAARACGVLEPVAGLGCVCVSNNMSLSIVFSYIANSFIVSAPGIGLNELSPHHDGAEDEEEEMDEVDEEEEAAAEAVEEIGAMVPSSSC